MAYGAISGDDDKAKTRHIRDRMAEMKQARLPYEDTWRDIAEYIMPRRNFDLTPEPNALRRRVLVDTTAAVANERLAALFHGYMMAPAQPWSRPTTAGDEPTRVEAEWFEDAQWRMHEFLSGSRSSFRANVHETLLDDCAFGNSVLWMGDSGPLTKPFFIARPLKECWWDENERGEVDTLYREYTMTLRRAAEKWKDATKIQEKATREKANLDEALTFIHAVEPRAGGRAGASSIRKPFASITYCCTTEEIVSERGFDGFPFAVTRLMKHSGEVYGRGMGWNALPHAKLLNRMSETIIRAAELEAEPPLLDITGELQKLDRRPAAVNSLNIADLSMLGVDARAGLVHRLYEQGDTRLAVEILRDIRRQVELVFFVDWMSLRENGTMTATEVNERRDVRLRSMSPIVARGEQEKLTRIADRTFDLMRRARMFAVAPQSLIGREIEFEYTSPLMMAQRRSELEATQIAFATLAQAMELKPDVIDNADIDQMVRDALEAGGSPVRHTRGQAEVISLRDVRAQQQMQDVEIERSARLGATARDTGQAIASIMQSRDARAAA